MAIVVICKKCNGTGKVEKVKFKIFRSNVICAICNGKGKVDISSLNRNRRI